MLLTRDRPRLSRGAEQVAALAHRAMLQELATWPKPGLVSLVDRGSHSDMDAATLTCSADAIRPYFSDLARAGEANAQMPELRSIGRAAERAMMAATGGVNAHRGAIFSLGLICAAAGARHYASASAESSALAVGLIWGDAIMQAQPLPLSHGRIASRTYGVGGASAEAASGFQTVRKYALPALRRGRRLRPNDTDAAKVQCLLTLIARLDDTNLLHRGGVEGLAFAQTAASGFLSTGGVAAADWLGSAERLHHAFVARNLSPGGSADLLAVTLLLDALDEL